MAKIAPLKSPFARIKSASRSFRWRSQPVTSAFIPKAPKHSITKLQVLVAAYNWALWSFLMVLILSQLFTLVRNTTTSYPVSIYGQDVSAGLSALAGQNDEPYSDRMVVCMRRGKTFKAVGLMEALASKTAIVEDSTGTAIHGFRVANRATMTLSQTSKKTWTRTCRLIESTIEYLFSICESFGYNVTRDDLRITDDVYSSTLKRIPQSLPVLIMPLWDNGPLARYVIPSWDGSACYVHLSGNYEDPSVQRAYAFGISRSVRERLTTQWLGRPGGKWRNGWFEDPQGMRWHADMISTSAHEESEYRVRQFDAVAQRELTCANASDCMIQTINSDWGTELHSTRFMAGLDNIIISNGSRYGLFYVRIDGPNIVSCNYDLAAFVSNASVIALLVRWMATMLTLNRSYIKGVSSWHNADIGSVSNAYSFIILPVAMLPRLKTILAVFYTIGCEFEGEQKALGDSWFVMYPSIVNLGFIHASLLNVVAKIFRRRVSSCMFGFMISTLSGIHWCRLSIAQSTTFRIGGRIETVIGSDEFEGLGLADFFTAQIAMRMNGNVSSLLMLKLAVVSASFVLPLICLSDDMTLHSQPSKTLEPCYVEEALSIRACNVGGIGRSCLYETTDNSNLMLNAYELIRLGYVVVGNRYLMTWDNWFVLTTVERMRRVYLLWNYRIVAFRTSLTIDANGSRAYKVNRFAQFMSLADPELNRGPWWDIDVRPIL